MITFEVTKLFCGSFSIISQLHKVQLFSPSPPPAYKSDNEITEVDTELKEFKQSKPEDDSPEE